MRSSIRTHALHPSRRQFQAATTPPSAAEWPGNVTIRKLSLELSDEVLLNIFRHYLDASPQFWPRLVHICRKWRHIVFASQRALHLRLFCTHGTPVLKTLDCWPALPIVVQYGGLPALNPPAPEDEDNVVAALKQFDRVSSISLTVTSSLLEKLSAIEGSFSELEELVLLSRHTVQPTLPSVFRWGSRLRTLHLTSAAILSLPELISRSTALVDLQLHKIPETGFFSPDAFVSALSGMTQLQSLSVHFLPFALHREYFSSPSRSGERVVLPVLTWLKYRGSSMYLNDFAAGINAPRLGDIDITFFFSKFRTHASQLGQFINRIKMQKSHRRAEILYSERAISISFTQPAAPTRLELQVSCKVLSRQLTVSYMAQICHGLSASLLGVEHLRIDARQPPSVQGDGDRNDWLNLIRPFRGTKWIRVTGGHSLSIVLASALRHSTKQDGTVLPALHKIYVREPEPRYYAPVQEAVVSLVHSRSLSGQTIAVEYERLCASEPRGTVGPFSRGTIEILPDDVVLNIFCQFLHTSPQSWPTLTHACQRWRQIVFTSPLGLNLQLYCTYGTPVLKTLGCWPALPVVLQYGGSPTLESPAPEDEDNIVAALKYSDRVSSIGLTITSSLRSKFSTVEMPFSELEELVLLSRDTMVLNPPRAFRWGQRLRTLHLTKIAIPTLPELLAPSTGLVDLQLHEIPKVGYFSPEALASALSGMVQLQAISLHFLSFPCRRNFLGLPPQPGQRIVLPALTRLKYRGTSKYLDSFVARIDAPRLGDIGITFFSQPTMDASELGRFIERTEMRVSLSQADVRTSEHAISISFTQPSAPTRLELRIPCKQLDWQLSYITQICDHFSPFMSCVEDLGINADMLSSDWQGDVEWSRLLHFKISGGTEYQAEYIYGGVRDILSALGLTGDGEHPTVFPALRTLRLFDLEPMHGSLLEAVESFTITQEHFGNHVQVYTRERWCKICGAGFTKQEELKKHLVVWHAYRLVCPYCGDFDFTPRYSDLFREHLANKHPEVSHTETLVLNPTTSQSSSTRYAGSDVAQHDDLHASVIFERFVDFKTPSIFDGSQTWLDAVHFLHSPYGNPTFPNTVVQSTFRFGTPFAQR
ncbi:hypothetical protein EDB83DRAFT_84673 [Lactarius deliciosus]|nr:hypothetical protein EDB83DRAFT_84673 [Lactarius deliciosus]